jgi:hypothetical protein
MKEKELPSEQTSGKAAYRSLDPWGTFRPFPNVW